MLASSLAWFLVPGEICIWWRGDDRVTVRAVQSLLSPATQFPAKSSQKVGTSASRQEQRSLEVRS